MFETLINLNIWLNSNYFTKTSVFLIILFSFCSIIFVEKLFRRKSVISANGKAVLITGCDSGFGNKLALRLNSLGYRVYATVLDPNSSDSQSLTNNCSNIQQMVVWKMDVTIDEEVEKAFLKVKQDLQRNDCILWAVVNNAGFGILSQLEWIGLGDYKTIFEVNVFGLIRVTKTFLPLIRESKGRIISQSSLLGKEPLNGYGAYCMTKYAVTAFCRTLRRELNKFDIKVILLFGGGFKNTHFIENTFKSFDRIWNELEDSLKTSYGDKQYYELWKKRQIFAFDYIMSPRIECVINDLEDAITNSSPKLEYRPMGGPFVQLLANLVHFVPNSLIDKIDSY